MSKERILREWMRCWGDLTPAQQNRFLQRSETRYLAQIPWERAKVLVGKHKKLATIRAEARRYNRALSSNTPRRSKTQSKAMNWAEPGESRSRGGSRSLGIERSLGSGNTNRSVRNRKTSKNGNKSANRMPFASDSGGHRHP